MQKCTLLFFVSVLLFSCRSSFPVAYNSEKAKNPDYKNYIKLKTGNIVTGDSLEIKNQDKLFKATVYSLNGESFKSKEIQEYQNASGLYVNIGGGLTKALTGPRINVFKTMSVSSYQDIPVVTPSSTIYHTTTRASIDYYIKKAGQDDVKMVSLNSTKTLKDWVSDNDEAYEQASLAHKYSNRVKLHQVLNWGGIIGGLALIALDPNNQPGGKGNNSDKVSVMSYAGLGMFCGGLINIPINLFVRRAKVGSTYAEAINVYNITPVKGKKK